MDTKKKLLIGAIGGAAAGVGALAYGTKKLLSSKMVQDKREELMMKGAKFLGELKDSYDAFADQLASRLGLGQPELQPAVAGVEAKYKNTHLIAEQPTFHDTLNQHGIDPHLRQNTNFSATKPVRTFNRHR